MDIYLPKDILEIIFSILSPCDILNVRLVNRQLKTLVNVFLSIPNNFYRLNQHYMSFKTYLEQKILFNQLSTKQTLEFTLPFYLLQVLNSWLSPFFIVANETSINIILFDKNETRTVYSKKFFNPKSREIG
jgi:hypothetical protein